MQRGRKRERGGEIGEPFYGCVVRRTATAKHKNPFVFLQRAALMSRELESGMELELKLKLQGTRESEGGQPSSF